ncbi:ATP-binding cassette domain-containing protein [Aestuariibius sp. 2305UL40-4]|uniref:thiamine ABC transporter ATP-binding protein n=1 Tax=Aestuariibius violaceus TaxID=3234132 RepID=UPI00345EA18D
MLTFDAVEIAFPSFRLTASLDIQAGRRVAVIGPSGAGKSTLLGAIAGFVQHEGAILWQGERIDGLPPAKRPVAMLFQDNNLFTHLTLGQNVGLGLRPDLRLAPDDKAAADAALDRVGLGRFGSRKPGSLSGGQQSRAALARVLVMRRPLLLLDEPFAALGPALKDEMLDLVAELAEETGATVLMVTHDPRDAVRLSEEAVFVADGVAAPPVPTPQLLEDPPPKLAAYLGRR